MEPLEEVYCEVQEEHSGAVIEALTLRRGELLEMVPLHVRRNTDLAHLLHVSSQKNT